MSTPAPNLYGDFRTSFPTPADGVPINVEGGPCAAAPGAWLPVAKAASGSAICQNVVYVPDPRDTNWPPTKPYTPERWITAQAAANLVSTAPAYRAKNAQGAWVRLMTTLALYAPGQLSRQRQATARIRSIARATRRRR